ncbi:hypothetical protein GGR50DRAFT_605968 [Xylaria sp. CBS 124048]|nr:hypothetical protein GGR50DRAFT_605968 [Xylaria sp. CBS 124048]
MVKPAFTGGFQFITSINTVTHDEETRRKVRSHARRQKLPNENNSPPSQSRKLSSQKERISKFRIRPSTQQNDAGSGNVSAARNSSALTTTKSQRLSIVKHVPPEPGRRNEERGKDGNFTPTMVSPELALVVARELPNFSMLRIETTPLTETLLKYCFTVCLCPREAVVEKWFDRAGAPTYMMTYYSGFLANAFAMNPEGNFFDSLHVDAAITHAFMATVASMHNSLAQWSDTSTFDFHRLQAIKAINERLNIEGKAPGVSISDGITMAVALLVNNETFTGSIQAAAAHMCGLKRIVDLRGGILDGFKYITVIQRALVWADFSYAYASGQPLVFPFVPQLATPLTLHYRFQGRSTEGTPEFGSKSLVIHNRDIIDILELLSSITRCLSSFDYNNIANMSTERIRLSDSIYLAEWQLFRLEHSYRNLRASKRAESLSTGTYKPIVEESSPFVLDLSESLMLAAHLFMHLALRGQPPAAPRHRGITEALVSCLYHIVLTLNLFSNPEPYGSPRSYHSTGSSLGSSSVESWSTTTSNSSVTSNPLPKPEDDFTKNTLLWALFVGSCVRIPAVPVESTTAGDQRQFFVHALRNYCIRRGIMNKERLATKLKDVIWLHSWCENQLDMIWDDIRDHLGA